MFDYFGVLLSIIFGLALTHVLRGLGRLVQLRHETRAYWVHVVWSLNVVIYVLSIWWGMYWWKELQDWSVAWFMYIATYAIAIFMWSFMLFPQEFAPGVDFADYFYTNRRWFFGVQAVVCLLDLPETLRKETLHLRATPTAYPYVISGFLLLSLVGLFTGNRRVHAVVCVLWMLLALGYMFFSPLSRIIGLGH